MDVEISWKAERETEHAILGASIIRKAETNGKVQAAPGASRWFRVVAIDSAPADPIQLHTTYMRKPVDRV